MTPKDLNDLMFDIGTNLTKEERLEVIRLAQIKEFEANCIHSRPVVEPDNRGYDAWREQE